MKRNVSKIFKQKDYINVYQTMNNPDMVYKQYLYDANRMTSIEPMKQARKKLLAMKNRKEWPEFLIRPTVVERFNKYSFTVGFPFVEGISLQTYMKTKDINIQTLAKLIKILEENIYSEKDFVFPDFANSGNIIILPNENTGDIDFKLIDPDDVQFDGYKGLSISHLICPAFDSDDIVRGINKCQDGERYNKQLDIRSMYALLYHIMNGEDDFIPTFIEREDLSEYESTLRLFNVPDNSSLYEKSMKIMDEKTPNESIGDSLYELINEGYELKTYRTNRLGYMHRLVKK